MPLTIHIHNSCANVLMFHQWCWKNLKSRKKKYLFLVSFIVKESNAGNQHPNIPLLSVFFRINSFWHEQMPAKKKEEKSKKKNDICVCQYVAIFVLFFIFTFSLLYYFTLSMTWSDVYYLLFGFIFSWLRLYTYTFSCSLSSSKPFEVPFGIVFTSFSFSVTIVVNEKFIFFSFSFF